MRFVVQVGIHGAATGFADHSCWTQTQRSPASIFAEARRLTHGEMSKHWCAIFSPGLFELCDSLLLPVRRIHCFNQMINLRGNEGQLN
jgi:hypothetical protein